MHVPVVNFYKHSNPGNNSRNNDVNTMKKKRECDTCLWIEKEKIRNKGDRNSGEISLALYEAMQNHQLLYHRGETK